MIGLAVAVFWPPKYEAVATFAPERASAPRIPGGFAELAGQFGASLAGEPTQSAAFYSDLLESRRVLEVVLQGRYPTRSKGGGVADSASLLTILDVQGRDSANSLDNGVRALRRSLSIGTDIRTNIVTVRYLGRDADVSALVVNRLVRAVNAFNTGARQSQAQRRRAFIQGQVDSVGRELSMAEENLKNFYDRNRSWAQSPELQYRLGQLQRQVEIVKEVYLQLRREFEGARIAEVDNVPLISVIDYATPPTEKASPNRKAIVLGALLLGIVVFVVFLYVRWFLTRSSEWAAVFKG
jgi:uncharacterized protein involved in exopolysaccharide biosynthesis